MFSAVFKVSQICEQQGSEGHESPGGGKATWEQCVLVDARLELDANILVMPTPQIALKLPKDMVGFLSPNAKIRLTIDPAPDHHEAQYVAMGAKKVSPDQPAPEAVPETPAEVTAAAPEEAAPSAPQQEPAQAPESPAVPAPVPAAESSPEPETPVEPEAPAAPAAAEGVPAVEETVSAPPAATETPVEQPVPEAAVEAPAPEAPQG